MFTRLFWDYAYFHEYALSIRWTVGGLCTLLLALRLVAHGELGGESDGETGGFHSSFLLSLPPPQPSPNVSPSNSPPASLSLSLSVHLTSLRLGMATINLELYGVTEKSQFWLRGTSVHSLKQYLWSKFWDEDIDLGDASGYRLQLFDHQFFESVGCKGGREGGFREVRGRV